jgi:hypothetical protein
VLSRVKKEEEGTEPRGTAKIDAISKHRESGLTREICANPTIFAGPQFSGIKRIDREVSESSIEAQGHEIFRMKIWFFLAVPN